MRGVGPSAPRRDNETKIQDASREPRGLQAQADMVKQGGPPSLHPCPCRAVAPAARSLDATPHRCLWLQSLSDFVIGRESFPCPGLGRCLAGPTWDVGQRFQSRISPPNIPLKQCSSLMHLHRRSPSFRPRCKISNEAPVVDLLGCGTRRRDRGRGMERGMPLKNRDKTPATSAH